jgi:hypothetical protein
VSYYMMRGDPGFAETALSLSPVGVLTDPLLEIIKPFHRPPLTATFWPEQYARTVAPGGTFNTPRRQEFAEEHPEILQPRLRPIETARAYQEQFLRDIEGAPPPQRMNVPETFADDIEEPEWDDEGELDEEEEEDDDATIEF